MPLRVAMVGVGHWHTANHVRGIREAGAQVVGICDAEPSKSRAWADRLDCPVFDDHLSLVESTKPDLVYCTPRVDQAAATVRELLDLRLPLVVEKPLGLTAAEIWPLAKLARQTGVFAAVAFVNRYSAIWREYERLRAAGEAGSISLLQTRLINGPPSRYERDGVGWMLDPARSGGGCLRNLGIHGADAFLALCGEARVLRAQTSSAVHGLDIEDYAIALLRGPADAIGVVEAGYVYPSSSGGDFEWRIVAGDVYLTQTRDELIVATARGAARREAASVGPELYAAFGVETIRRLSSGEAPLATIEDCARAAELIDRIYTAASADA